MAESLLSPLLAPELWPPALHWWCGAVLFGAWLFALGASLGSFLNVVIYRLPAGLNLSRPGSRCPCCLHPIRVWDNIPVLGWLRLGGRCRDCGAPISVRYLLLELLFGGVVLCLGLLEVVELGLNLPDPPLASQRVGHVGFSPLALGLLLVLHIAWLTSLLAAAAMQWDGARPPAALFAPVAFFALFATAAIPELRPIPALPLTEPQLASWFPQAGPALRAAIAGLLDSLVSGGVTAFAGAALGWGCARFWPSRCVREFPWLAALAAAGLTCGWQWAGWMVALGGLLWLGQSLASRLGGLRPRPAPAAWYWVASLVCLLAWCWLHDLRWRLWIPESVRDYYLPLCLLAAGVLLAWLAAAAAPPAESPRAADPTQPPEPRSAGGDDCAAGAGAGRGPDGEMERGMPAGQ